jgi:hypothetical protein
MENNWKDISSMVARQSLAEDLLGKEESGSVLCKFYTGSGANSDFSVPDRETDWGISLHRHPHRVSVAHRIVFETKSVRICCGYIQSAPQQAKCG